MAPPNPPRPRISDAEWLVMRVLWTRSPATVNDVHVALEPATGWKLKTVMTLLNRLVKKGVLTFEKVGRAYHYTPRLKEADCVRAERRSFLQRVYGGALKPMLAHFLEEASLSTEEIDDLKRLLNKKDRERRRGK